MNGVVATDLANPSSPTRRRARLEPERRVHRAQIEKSVHAARSMGPGVVDVFDQTRSALIDELKRDPELQAAVAAQFRRDVESNLNQSHDFMQLVKLVRGYAESLLHERFPTLSPEDAADKLPTEGSIYYSTVLMTMKVDSLLFIGEANRAVGRESRIRLHPLVLKYLRIYNWQAMQKNLSISLGECQSVVYYNGDALGAVVQSLLDNMVKYAPAGSAGSIAFHEHDGQVTVRFESLGPRIEESERSQIFMLKYRGKSARKVELAGQGIGLATAKNIADALGLRLRVNQDEKEHPQYPQRYNTRFEVEFIVI